MKTDLKNLAELFTVISKKWNDSESQVHDKLNENYPFTECFDELAVKVKQWVEYQNSSPIEHACKLITLEMINTIEHGEEKPLTDTYSLYKYNDEDIITVILSYEWEEVLQVLTDGNEIIFEQL